MAAASRRGKGSTRSSDIRPTRLSRTAPDAYRAHTARAGGARRGETDDDTGRDAHRPPRTPPKTPPPPRPPGRGRPDPDGGRGDAHPPVDAGRPAEGHESGRPPLPRGEQRRHHTQQGDESPQGHDTTAHTPPGPDVTEGAGREGTGAAHAAAAGPTTVVGGTTGPTHGDAAATPSATHTRTPTGAGTDTTTVGDDAPAAARRRTRGQARAREGPRPLPPAAEHLPGRLRAAPAVSRERPVRGSSV